MRRSKIRVGVHGGSYLLFSVRKLIRVGQKPGIIEARRYVSRVQSNTLFEVVARLGYLTARSHESCQVRLPLRDSGIDLHRRAKLILRARGVAAAHQQRRKVVV